MSIAIAIWSLTVAPGEPQTFTPQADIKITNAALGAELSDETGRTTVKLVYISPAMNDDEDEEEDEAGKPQAVDTVLCSLTPGKIEQATIDLILEEGEEYVFELVGKNPIHLTGNYIDQVNANQVPFNDMSDDDSDEGAYALDEVSSDVEMDANDLDLSDNEDGGRFEEITEAIETTTTASTLKRPRVSDGAESASASKPETKAKKQKVQDGSAVPTGATEAPEDKMKKSKKEKKKEKKDKEGKEEVKEAVKEASKEADTKEASKGEVKELASGLKYKDAKIGAGPQAKKGNTVSMRYIGKLQNGKVFDKNTGGKPFTFHLGAGEVIKGWDEGIIGMAVGGERLLTIPPNLAYGKRKTEGIPPSSTLIFECKLVDIKK